MGFTDLALRSADSGGEEGRLERGESERPLDSSQGSSKAFAMVSAVTLCSFPDCYLKINK